MGIALRRFRVPGSLPPGSCAPGPLPGETRPPGQALRSFCAPVLAVQVLHSVKLDLQDKGSVIPALQVLEKLRVSHVWIGETGLVTTALLADQLTEEYILSQRLTIEGPGRLSLESAGKMKCVFIV
ncbi:uncharacterized protein LOC124178691 isoform X2 [Neodiprion fabricii]|uniref:uncharacterized protein LOC124178691 isoform X2 n=1 Tax=Neodiprion fabricii TaxID=2872261 RepID=UPI001ED8FDC6|nr:uncharacterized protein LOC124178691 isoform X2 [Neodiprion fabricii]